MESEDHGSTSRRGSLTTRTVQSRYDWSQTSPSRAIIDAIASIEDVDPVHLSTELGTTLYDHVDPEALDAIVSSDRATAVEITFSIGRNHITIDGAGRLVVTTEEDW